MYEKVRAYVQEYAMLKQSDSVIAGISGGADSICLLCVLINMQKEYDLKITAVHVNHGLRGEAADADEAYVKEFCENANVPLEIYHIDVNKMAKEMGMSGEEAGREARREAFADAMEKYGGTKIALAHHMNDSVETVLLNIARGTGVKGLTGIRPVNDCYIRPLLCLKREEIENYLEENNISYCIDQTNLEDIYTRNRIRNRVIPYMETQVNEKFVEHVQGLAVQMTELSDYMERQTEAAYRRCVKEEKIYSINIEAFLKEDAALQPYIMKKVLCQAAGKEKDIETSHVKLMENLTGQQSGKKISLPYRLQAVKSYGNILVGTAEELQNMQKPNEDEPQVEMRVFECEKMPDSFPQMPYTKWFDYDIIKNSVIIRKRRAGDYITIDNKGNTQTIKKYFINAKIPKEQRDNILLVTDGNHVMWVVGYRQNQAYQVSERTKRILEIKINGGQENGRNS